MNNDRKSIYLRQGELYMSIGGVTDEEIDRMNEIRLRNPEENWDERELELLRKAAEELKAEKEK